MIYIENVFLHGTHDLQNVLGEVGQDLQINVSVTFTKSAPRPIQFMLFVPLRRRPLPREVETYG